MQKSSYRRDPKFYNLFGRLIRTMMIIRKIGRIDAIIRQDMFALPADSILFNLRKKRDERSGTP